MFREPKVLRGPQVLREPKVLRELYNEYRVGDNIAKYEQKQATPPTIYVYVGQSIGNVCTCKVPRTAHAKFHFAPRGVGGYEEV